MIDLTYTVATSPCICIRKCVCCIIYLHVCVLKIGVLQMLPSMADMYTNIHVCIYGHIHICVCVHTCMHMGTCVYRCNIFYTL